MDIERVLARTISTLFHPLIIPLFGVLVLFSLNTYVGASVPTQAKVFILGIMFVNTVLAPALAIFLLKRFGLISNVSLHDKSDRLIPLLITSMLYIFTYYLIKQIPLPSLLYYYVMGTSMLILVCLIISFRWKISIHMVAAGGFAGMMIATSLLLRVDLSGLIMLAIFFSGLIGFSQLKLTTHSSAEVYAGFITGISAMLLLYGYLRS